MTRPLLPLVLVIALVGCGDADAPALDETTTVVAPSTDASAAETVAVEATPEADASDTAPLAASTLDASKPGAAPATRSGAPTTAQCRAEVGPSVTQEPMRLVAGQTFAATSPGLGVGCFVTAYDPVSMADGSVYPYSYTFTDATGARERTLTTMPSAEPDAALRLVAVGFGDLDEDGRPDVVMVHDGCERALSWLSNDEDWIHTTIDDGESGLPACTVAEARAAYAAYWADPISP